MKKIVFFLSVLLWTQGLYATDFASLRKGKSMTIPSGTVIEGIIVSDYRYENTELNPNLEWNRVDLSLTHRTAYIEAVDGSCGYRLVFPILYHNRFERGTLVAIDVSGCYLQAEKKPERYTIQGVDGGKVTVKEVHVALPQKIKRIAQLEDADIYTHVTLSSLEFLDKQGSFSNINERCTITTPLNNTVIDAHYNAADGWAQLLEDADGNAIYMQINASCQWRRNNRGAPKGVGEVSGVLVTGDNRRYGVSFGPYSIRPIVREDIAIPMKEATAFKTIASWRWDRNYKDALHLKEAGWVYWIKSFNDDAILAEKGEGLLYNDASVEMALTKEFNGRHCTDGEGLGSRRAAAIAFKGTTPDWIHPGGNSGIIIQTSTLGYKGNGLIFNFSFVAGDGTASLSWGFPANWTVEYSTDGIHYSSTGYKTCLRPLAAKWQIYDKKNFYSTPYDAAMGYCEQHVVLPSSLLGQETVYVKIVPEGNTLVKLTSDPSADINTLKMSNESDKKVMIRLGMAELKVF